MYLADLLVLGRQPVQRYMGGGEWGGGLGVNFVAAAEASALALGIARGWAVRQGGERVVHDLPWRIYGAFPLPMRAVFSLRRPFSCTCTRAGTLLPPRCCRRVTRGLRHSSVAG